MSKIGLGRRAILASATALAAASLMRSHEARAARGLTVVLESEVTILDPANMHTGTASMKIVPRCNQSCSVERARCECLCSANYVDGKCNLKDWDGGRPTPNCEDGGTQP